MATNDTLPPAGLCVVCGFTASGVSPERVAQALALLGAVETLANLPGDWCATYERAGKMHIVDRVLTFDDGPRRWKAYGGPMYSPERAAEYGTFDTPAAALIALAEAVKEGGHDAGR